LRHTAAAYAQPLIEVIVDDPAAGRQLAHALVQHGVLLLESRRVSDDCWDWQAARVDDDWRDFPLPF
jgi:TusA-related sulfurtransferase